MTKAVWTGREGGRASFPFALVVALALGVPAGARGAGDVLERSYDGLRTGVNAAETVLTPANVASSAHQFHKRFVMAADGKIEGSPLYLSGVAIAGDTHDVVYVATMHNTVFAFDATNGAKLSSRQLDVPVIGADLHVVKPTTIHDEWGIAGTPVIDRARRTIYVVRWGYDSDRTRGPTFRLF